MGMPHRGRLNVLAHVLRKPYEMILSEFEGTFLPANIQGDGDVKYHLGYSHDRRIGERKIHLSLAPNPSHLEAIDPVVEGIVRAKQSYHEDEERRRVMPVLLHGDAAFTGQGLVYETLALSELAGFATGGTIHVIVNNQVGFTTSPKEGRFTRYPSDMAMVIQAPVFHVNGDDPEAAVQAARLAVAFRQKFRVDVFIELVCYRRHGHNEIDDPTFTQPVMYKEIREHPTITTLYANRLEKEGVITADEARAIRGELKSTLEDALAYARDFMPRQQVFALGGVWQGFSWAGEDWSAETKVSTDRLRALSDSLRRLPASFTPHKRVQKLLEERHGMVTKGEGIDWGCAETLAYASVLAEGTPVRLTGQDVGRGTFSHRHAILHDAETGEIHVPLNHVAPEQAEIEVVNSNLSEAGVLGFEYGMSSADPRRLVVWEAQFGDFANGAQVIIDQFVASAESKWQRMSGLVLLLPHGYEGQGPEHSSARLERYLQLCAEQNVQVVNCTTPAQIFHALRRQVRRTFRKPLVVMSPKSLLRHPKAVSTLAELSAGSFEVVLDDPAKPEPKRVDRLLLCSGKIFYALEKAREERTRDEVAIVRVEQLYPFPARELRAIFERYARAEDVAWVQEEPANMGAWTFLRSQLEAHRLDARPLRYVGREEAASPATGSYKIHQAEENAILDEALKRTPARRADGLGESRAAAG
jgi:2-oxoglutarate dehydrogenase E1 component